MTLSIGIKKAIPMTQKLPCFSRIHEYLHIPGFIENPKNRLSCDDFWIRLGGMIRSGFLSPEDRADLIALAQDGSAAHRLARRANALVLVDSGWSCEQVAQALFLDDDTVRKWRDAFVEEGLEGLTRFEAGGSACQLSGEQQEKLKAWITATLPHSTRQVGALD